MENDLIRKSVVETFLFRDKLAAILEFKTRRLESDITKTMEYDLGYALKELGPINENFLVILSFKYVDFIDMNGAKTIIKFWNDIALNYNAVLAFSNCNPTIDKFLRQCKVDHIVNIYDSDQDAIDRKD